MKYGYYPGCSLEGVSTEYDESVRSLFTALDIEMEEVPDWMCCGTQAAPSLSPMLGVATPLWSVVQARQADQQQVITPCSECLYHFKRAAREVAGNDDLRMKVESVIGQPVSHLPQTIHPLELLYTDLYENRIKQLRQRELSDLKVVCYYGCHISRPASVMAFDDPENPQSMDKLMEWAGVQVMDWSSRVDCCGAHFSLIKPDIVIDLCQPLFETAREVGADAIVVACPMCHANLDTRQEEIAVRIGEPLDMPVLYFSQVLGYALGLPADTLGFKKHIVDPLPLMLTRCQQRMTEEIDL